MNFGAKHKAAESNQQISQRLSFLTYRNRILVTLLIKENCKTSFGEKRIPCRNFTLKLQVYGNYLEQKFINFYNLCFLRICNFSFKRASNIKWLSRE